MSLLQDVEQSLRQMTLVHLLLAFLAFIGYMLAEGQLASRRVRVWSGVIAFLSALLFVIESPQWTAGAMLVVLAIGAIGLFSALVWTTSALLGLRYSDPSEGVAIPAEAPPAIAAERHPNLGATRPGPLHSH